jgi:N-acetylmuramic acid 6-phosphate etherase
MATLTMLEQAPTPKPVNRNAADFTSLTTETANAASEGLDTKSALEIARIINHEDAKIAAAVKKALSILSLALYAMVAGLSMWVPVPVAASPPSTPQSAPQRTPRLLRKSST